MNKLSIEIKDNIKKYQNKILRTIEEITIEFNEGMEILRKKN